MQFIRTIVIFILIKLNIFPAVHAQTPSRIDNDKVFNASRFGHEYISLSYNGEYLLRLPSFKNITVIDARPDTFAIGFRKREIELRKKLLQFENGLSRQLSGYLRNNCLLSKDSNAWSLVLAIRDLWLREYDVDADDQDKVSDNSGSGMNFRKSCLKLEFDCYINKGDAYYAAFRFDTIVNKFLSLSEFLKDYLKYTLQVALGRAGNLNIDSIAAKKRMFSLQDIDTYYKKRWDMPVLIDGFLQKGVYTSFEEFKKNRPSITDFELKKGKLADVLFADGKPTRNAWGYCDGNMIFIKAGENYYPLIRQENSFYFLGSTELNRSKRGNEYNDRYQDPLHPNQANNGYNYQTLFKNILLPLKLNWQTGKPY